MGGENRFQVERGTYAVVLRQEQCFTCQNLFRCLEFIDQGDTVARNEATGWHMTQLVECLPRKSEASIQPPVTTKRKKMRSKGRQLGINDILL
jgi:hypothetical protein